MNGEGTVIFSTLEIPPNLHDQISITKCSLYHLLVSARSFQRPILVTNNVSAPCMDFLRRTSLGYSRFDTSDAAALRNRDL